MLFKKTFIDGLLIYTPRIFEDTRGYFFESYHKKELEREGIDVEFVQDNQSKSSYGVLRGLHYQLEPFAQAKLIRVISGEIYDVAVDIRKNSATYCKWQGEILSAENRKQLFIPRGFAHGFVVLSKEAIVFYKGDNFYSKEYERGIIYNDKTLNIDWKIPGNDIILSEKDKSLPALKDAPHNFYVAV